MRDQEALTAGDTIGAIIAGAFSTGPLTMLYWAPRFEAMFADLGGEFPAITRFALNPWFGPFLAVIPAALLILALVRPAAPLAQRRALIIASFIAGCLASALCLFALYMPIFELAGAITSDGARKR